MRVYKFLPLEFALSDIALRRLKVARLADLNDPFEFYAARISRRAAAGRLPQVRADIDERSGLICFSRDWQNPVLWSHYAMRHTGLCLGFDVPDEDVRAVDYTAERIELPDDEQTPVDPAVVERLVVTKYRDWAYEQELRIVMPLARLTDEAGVYYRDFDERLVLREVKLGARCALLLDHAMRLTKAYGGDVRVATTRLAFRTFRIVDAHARTPDAPA